MKCPKCNTDIDPEKGTCPRCSSGASRHLLASFFKHMDAILAVLFLSAMVLIVCCQILLRNFRHTGIEGADFLVRHLVLWVVFAGASVATREDQHIHIDLLPRFLPSPLQRMAKILVTIFSVAVTGALSYASFEFVKLEMESGLTLPSLGIPVWVVESIIPVGYSVIALHFTLGGLKKALNGRVKTH